MLAAWKKSSEKPRQCIKKQRHYFVYKGPYIQSYGFSSSRVQMWELDNKIGWPPKNWCLKIVVLEKTLESHLDSKEIKSVNPKGNQSWIFTGRTDAEAEAPILWPPDAKGQLTGKHPDAGKDWKQEKGTTEDEMVGWHQWDMSLSKLQDTVKEKGAWCTAIHGVAKSWTRLSDWTTQCSIVYMYHAYFIHSSVSGHLGCFHVLVIVNSAGMNIEVYVSFWIRVYERWFLSLFLPFMVQFWITHWNSGGIESIRSVKPWVQFWLKHSYS